MHFSKKGDKGIMEINQSFLSSLSERNRSIIQLYLQGLSSYKIADRLKINRHTVTKVLKDNNIPIRTKNQYDENRKKRIITLFKQGKSIYEISEIVGVSHYSVRLTLEEENLTLKKYERDILNVARYIYMKNKGFDTQDIAKFLNMTEKALNKLIRNSGINISSVRRKTKNIDNLADIIEKKLKGQKNKDIAMYYNLDIVTVKEILDDFGLF
ncbi:MAG: helix-turn-helix domain-containing protein [Candidatus Heimdallarchaeum endolithica]|uniref:Helix-turn-helix domain-containing protein n=1 Tax=Candidatus Heimdallarchaeum endolithica TaxID=2876572 RepID=A0A9Y1FNZ1_9ARCH|nr:MAG: helix-turn-helix domain-containing protein [Candidatus Heimdallarchaeum endolithica]